MLDHYPVVHFASTWLQVEWSNKYSFLWFITEKKSAGEKKIKDPQIKQNRDKSYIEGSKRDLQYQEVTQTRTTCL